MNTVNRIIARRNTRISVLVLAGVLSIGIESLSAQNLEVTRPDFGTVVPSLVTVQSALADIYDNNNRKIGEVQNLFVNPQSGAIEQVGIQFDLDATDRTRIFLVPWNQFTVTRRNNGALALVMDQATVDRVRLPGSVAAPSSSPQSSNQSFSSGSESNAGLSRSAPAFGR